MDQTDKAVGWGSSKHTDPEREIHLVPIRNGMTPTEAGAGKRQGFQIWEKRRKEETKPDFHIWASRGQSGENNGLLLQCSPGTVVA